VMTHILLIEDDLDDQEIFLSALTGIPGLIACETVDGGSVALAGLRSGEIAPDIIFLDLKMEGINGFEFMNQVRISPTLRKIPIIIITDSADPLDIEMSKIAGAKRFITKPEDALELEKAIKESVQTFS
ncbi:MAG: response regulator, partial [Chitinophagaceae bacterium]